jgi:hypothetical protein
LCPFSKHVYSDDTMRGAVSSGLVTCAFAAAACGRIGFNALASDALEHGDASGPGDAGGGAGICPGIPGSLFCDDFENGLGQWQTGGTVAVTTTLAHSGTHSLEATTNGALELSWAQAAPLASLATGELYARAWFYVPSTLSLSHADLLHVESASQGGVVFVVVGGIMNVYNSLAGGFTVDTGVTMPLNTWFCIEQDITISATAGAIAIEENGAELGSSAPTSLDTLPGSGYQTVSVGMPSLFPPAGAGSLYVDDVAVGTQHIACN